MNFATLKRMVPCLVVLAIAAWAPAPIAGHPEDRKLLEPEATQQDLARQQALMKQQSEVGSVDMKGDQAGQVVGSTDPNASKAIASAHLDGPENDPLAAAAVTQAGEDLQSRGKSGASFWLWGILLAAMGFLGVIGLRQWADKAIPEPVTQKPLQW